MNRGVYYRKKDHHIQTIADYTEAIRLNPNYGDAYNNRGVCYIRHDDTDYDRAIADFTEAIRCAPGDYLAYSNRGGLYNEKHEYDRALIDVNEALRINPQYGNAYSNRGFSHQGKCLYDLAMADFSEAIRLRPQLADPYYGRGICYQEHERDYARALSDYDMALSITGEFKLALKDRQNAEDRRQQALDALNNSAQ